MIIQCDRKVDNEMFDTTVDDDIFCVSNCSHNNVLTFNFSNSDNS